MKKKIFLLLCTVLFFSCSEEPEIRQGHCIPFYISDTYKFPIRPGTDEWKAFQTREEMVNACKIPQKVLNSISTEGLLETLLNYPFINDYIFFDHLQSGFQSIKTENNCFAELFGRDDIFNIITERYELMSLDCGGIYPPFDVQGKASPVGIAFQAFEFFVFQDDFLDKLNKNQMYQVFELIYEKLQDKQKNDNISEYTKLVSFACLGKIMFKGNFTPFVEVCNKIEFMNFFITEIPMYRPSDVFPFQIIEKYAKEYKTSR